MGRELDCTQFCGMKGLYTTLTVFCVNMQHIVLQIDSVTLCYMKRLGAYLGDKKFRLLQSVDGNTVNV